MPRAASRSTASRSTRWASSVDPEVADVRFDGEPIRIEKPIHFVVHKPQGYLCTSADEYGRRTVISLVKDRHRRRLFTVGRLDEDSEGLIFVTNDGEFSNQVAHPRYGLEKTYELKLHGQLSPENLDRVRKGVWLSTGKSKSMYVQILKRSKQFTYVCVVIHEGKNRQLRRIFAKVGNAVARLKRTRIGPIAIRSLKKGTARRLSHAEVESILAQCERNRQQGGARELGLRSADSERYAGEKVGKKTIRKKKAAVKKAARKKTPAGRSGARQDPGDFHATARRQEEGLTQEGLAEEGREPQGGWPQARRSPRLIR